MPIAKIKLTIYLDYEIDSDLEERTQFYLEESICFDNYLDQIINEREEGKCSLCWRAEAELLGVYDE